MSHMAQEIADPGLESCRRLLWMIEQFCPFVGGEQPDRSQPDSDQYQAHAIEFGAWQRQHGAFVQGRDHLPEA